MRLVRLSRAFAVAVVLLVFSPEPGSAAPASGGEPERFSAFAINPTGGSATLQIVVERWSTEEERQFLLNEFQTGGPEKLLEGLQRIKNRAGYLRGTKTLAYDIQFAAERPLEDGGRRIILATDRPISFFEMKNQTLSTKYAFTLVEIRMSPEGKGEGKVMLAAEIEIQNGVPVIKNYGTQPVRLNSISRMK